MWSLDRSNDNGVLFEVIKLIVIEHTGETLFDGLIEVRIDSILAYNFLLRRLATIIEIENNLQTFFLLILIQI